MTVLNCAISFRKLRDVGELETLVKGAVASARPRVTAARIAKAVGQPEVTDDVVSNMLNGRTKLSRDVAETVRKLLEKPAGWPWSELYAAQGKVSLAGTPLTAIPVVGTVGAGPGTYNVDYDERTIWVPANLANIGGLGFVVDGDSMMPVLEEGTIAIFREWRQPKRGYPFLVRLRDGSLVVKNVEWREGAWVLESINQMYKPIPMDGASLLGYLIGWYKSNGTRESTDSDPNGLTL